MISCLYPEICSKTEKWYLVYPPKFAQNLFFNKKSSVHVPHTQRNKSFGIGCRPWPYVLKQSSKIKNMIS